MSSNEPDVQSPTPSGSSLCFLSIGQAGTLLRQRRISPVELTHAFLDRIGAIDERLHSYITITRDHALEAARIAEAAILAGDYRGPLHGIPVALKDLYDTQGILTTAGCRVYNERIPAEDATTTSRLKAAGSILLGKTAMSELALGGPDFTSPYPISRNPWNTEHYTGGSSSGSGAAVAAGLCMGALGSCTGGSIRGPASLCGIVGMKPTYGRVSRFGVVPLSWSQDHCGPMTWTVEDTAYMLQAIAGYDPKDPTTGAAPVPDYSLALRTDIKGLTIGVPRDYFYASRPEVDPEVITTAEKGLETLQSLGANLEEVSIPSLEYVRAANTVIMLCEAFSIHAGNLKSRPQDFGDMVRARFRMGGMINGSDYVLAQRCRQLVKRECAEVFNKVDVLVTPTMTHPAPAFEGHDPTAMLRGPSYVAPFNLTGLPAMSVPAGYSSKGLPIGMQIVGKPYDEPTVLRVGYTYEQHARWFERRPPI